MDVPILVSNNQIAPFIFLGAGIVMAFAPALKKLSLAIAGLSFIAAYVAGVATSLALLPIMLLFLSVRFISVGSLCGLSSKANGAIIYIAYGVFVVVSVLLGLHGLPGFHNPMVVESIQFSARSAPYTQSLNYDKALLGFVLAFYFVNTYRFDRQASYIAIGTIILILSLTLSVELVKVELKWSDYFYAWMIINLLFTCIPEELFFRGYLQRHLSNTLGKHKLPEQVAIYAIGIVFGLAHIGGGLAFCLVATVAGCAYGYVYHKTENILYAIATHFLLNAAHIMFFTYPSLA